MANKKSPKDYDRWGNTGIKVTKKPTATKQSKKSTKRGK